MSTQVISWAMIALPWFTLFFMKKEDIKRFMPAALFTVVSSTIIYESSITFNMWSTRETAYPLNQMLPSIYGLFPVLTIWILKFTYDRFWLYLATNAALDIFWAYILIPWFVTAGILGFLKSRTFVFILSVCHAVLIYGYQLWQKDALLPAPKGLLSLKIRPAETKPLLKERDDTDSRY
ncbi:MAG: hypothetical protein HPY50_11055 [Firmicutes bacterium]|nr:hypothetical protein [Bacillota bacterium]